MYRILGKDVEKKKLIIAFASILLFFFLVSVVYKNDSSIQEKAEGRKYSLDQNDLNTIKEFFYKQIKSPFINISHVIKSGDTIEKILKKYNVESSQIQKTINQYKKYSKPNQLLVGNKIDLVIEEVASKEKNSITTFFIPITKSTSIEIKKNDEGKLEAKKIITKLYKRKVLAGNEIKKNLYSAAVDAKINPDTIIEFARIFGFEIDFQRDIRKNDNFKIVYDKYFDEGGGFV